MDKEIFKDIEGYNGLYQISNFGNVKSFNCKMYKQGFIMKQSLNHKGYKIAYFIKNRKKKTISVHRLVALNFIDNPSNKPQVNHINGVKHDNHYSNLEWSTNSENMKHAFLIGLKVFSEKRRMQMNKKVLDANAGIIYNSAKEASTILNIRYQSLCEQLNGTRKNLTNLKYL